jgi:hypothetical protein
MNIPETSLELPGVGQSACSEGGASSGAVAVESKQSVVEGVAVVEELLSGGRSLSMDRCYSEVVLPTAPVSKVTTNLLAWKELLKQDTNSEANFVLEGIEHGFVIVDTDGIPDTFCRNNYLSATREHKLATEKQIVKELELGRYVVCDESPLAVSSLGAIPKPNGVDIRIIHDLSRPEGGINRLAEGTSVSYTTIDQAVLSIDDGSYLAKLDLEQAYRSIPIHPSCYHLTGLQWQFEGEENSTFMYDARLPFGAAMSCKIFTAISDTIARIMKRNGYVVLNYIDDFLCVGRNELECAASLKFLKEVLCKLGLGVNEKKTEGPARVLTFLGVSLDCITRTMSLPASKLSEVKCMLNVWSKKAKCTKKELQKLIGKLNWCARVVRGGAYFHQVFDQFVDQSTKIPSSYSHF